MADYPDFTKPYFQRFGVPQRLTYNQTHTVQEVVTLANLTGKGNIYMGVVAINGAATKLDDEVKIVMDGQTIYENDWNWLTDYKLWQIPNYPFSCVLTDNVLFYYTGVLQVNYTFDSSFVLTYEIKTAGNTTIIFEMLYALIE